MLNWNGTKTTGGMELRHVSLSIMSELIVSATNLISGYYKICKQETMNMFILFGTHACTPALLSLSKPGDCGIQIIVLRIVDLSIIFSPFHHFQEQTFAVSAQRRECLQSGRGERYAFATLPVSYFDLFHLFQV